MKYLGANETQSLISIVRGGKTEDSLYHKQSQSQLLWEWIVKFHIIVSEGPLYICSCCDKFWYKHAVSSATNKNILIFKIIFSKKQWSVNDIERLCKSCYKYQVKKKREVPNGI